MADEQKLVFRVATPFLWWVIYEEGQNWTFLRILNLAVFLLVSPLVLLMVVVSQMFARPLERSPDEVIGFLANEIEGQSEFRDWDDFISVPTPTQSSMRFGMKRQRSLPLMNVEANYSTLCNVSDA